MRIRFVKALVVAVSILAGGSAFAATGKAPWEDYGSRVKASQQVPTLGPDLMGDQVSHSNGALSFSMTDVSIPGNSALPMSVTRKYSVRDMRYRKTDGMLKDWELDLPEISATFVTEWHTQNPYGTGAINTNRCSQPGRPPLPTNFEGLTWDDFWHGVSINIPGVTSGELLRTNEGTIEPYVDFSWMTNDQVHVSCLTNIKNGTGQGFFAVAPDGTKYWFDWMARNHEPELKRGSFLTSFTNGATYYWGQNLPVYRYRLMATRVEDRFGNAIEYTYSNAWNQPARLTRIKDATGGEGRQIDITYSGDAIQRIDDGTRRWTYAYGTAPGSRGTLTSVNQGTPALPNQRTWTIGFSQFTGAEILISEVVPSGEEMRSCLYLQTPDNWAANPVGTITHPSGAVGTFTVSIVEHSRSNVPVACQNVLTPVGLPPGTSNDQNDDTNPWPFSYHAFSLKTKTISGNAMTPATWNYAYASDQTAFLVKDPEDTHINWSNPVCGKSLMSDCMKPRCFAGVEDCDGTARTTITGPDGTWTRYTYGNNYHYDEGKLRKVETGSSSSNILRTTTHQYDLDPTHFTWASGMQLNGASFQDERLRPLLRTDILQQGVTFTNLKTLDSVWARPISVTRSSTLGHTRTDTTTYADNITKWVMGQVATVTNTNLNRVTSKTDYHSGTAMPTVSYWPHVPGTTAVAMQTLTYNPDGTLASVKDGNNNVTTLSDWYRGVPKKIKYADLTEHNALVSPLGWITWVKDQVASETSYAYDDLGQLTSITYPTGDSVAWNATTLGFAKTTTAELGFPAGTWRQQVQTGDGIKRTYFDAMWRPRLTHEYDSAAQAVTQRFNAWAYDASGRTTFVAYPLAAATSTASFTEGVWTEYDTLGRVTSVTQDSELAAPYDTLTTLTEYLVNFETRVTNPRNKATTTRFKVWDEPDTSMPTAILAPGGVTTSITRDSLGRPTQVSRAGTWAGETISANRYYRYNTKGQVERHLTSEERATYIDYDDAGNVLHTYHCNSTSDATCGWTAAGGRPADRTSMTYDPMNRVTLIDYPTGTDDITTTYQADGAVDTIVMGIVTLDYEYNKRRMLTGERLIWNANNWLTSYGYNANGHQATLTYRDGHQVSFAPNALGQATQAGTYATGASYFPNGALKQFTYGNGIVHTLTQNARGLPERSQDVLGATKYLDDTYDYDQNGNVAAISDALSGQPGNRDMSYDDLDRLVGVTAGSAQGGNAVFAYDVLDNIRQLDQGTRTVRHTYDSVNRLDTITNAAGTLLSSYNFDTRGNLTSRTTGAVTDTFTFDKANRLKATSINGVASTYRYDGQGRRMQQTEAGVSSYFVYGQAGQLLFSQDGVNRYNHIHLAGSLVAKRLVPFSGTTSIRYQHTDALGSPVAETDEAGTLTRRERMTAYGEPADGTWQSGPGFTGHQMDATSRLVYMQQRYYDPIAGRFLSTDPVDTNVRSGGNFNRYTYANGNSFSNVDPDGRYSCNRKRSKANCEQAARAVRMLRKARRTTPNLRARAAMGTVVDFIGTEGDGNGVEITDTKEHAGNWRFEEGGGTIGVNFDLLNGLSPSDPYQQDFQVAATIAHEGWHGVSDTLNYAAGRRNVYSYTYNFNNEKRAGIYEALLAQGLNYDHPQGLWTRAGGINFKAINDQATRSANITCQAIFSFDGRPCDN